MKPITVLPFLTSVAASTACEVSIDTGEERVVAETGEGKLVLREDGLEVDDIEKRAGMLFQEEDYAGAARLFQFVALARPNDATVWRNWCTSAALAGERGTARDVCPKANRLAPKNAVVLGAIGWAHMTSDFKVAAEYYGQALELNPTPTAWHVNLVKALAELGDIKGAVAAAERAKKLAPDHPMRLVCYAKAKALVGDCREAKAALRRAEELGGDIAEAAEKVGTKCKATRRRKGARDKRSGHPRKRPRKRL